MALYVPSDEDTSDASVAHWLGRLREPPRNSTSPFRPGSLVRRQHLDGVSVPEKEVVLRTVHKAQHIVDRPQPLFAIVDALAMVKVARMGDAANQHWKAAFLSPSWLRVLLGSGEALAAGRAPQPDVTAAAPQVNNNDAVRSPAGRPATSAERQEDLYEPTMTTISGRLAGRQSVAELAAASLRRRPLCRTSCTTSCSRPTGRPRSSTATIWADGRIWIPAARLDHRLCVGGLKTPRTQIRSARVVLLATPASNEVRRTLHPQLRDDAAGPHRAPVRGDTHRAGPSPDVRLGARGRPGHQAPTPAVNAVRANKSPKRA